MTKVQVIAAGHGGQGILELANYIAYHEFLKGRHVAYTPSYGPESRGGRVKCYVVAADEEIDSPIVDEPDYLIVMNLPSMDFVGMLRKGGTLLVNSSLVPEDPERRDIQVYKIPASEIAANLSKLNLANFDDTKIAANSVMFGAYLSIAREGLDSTVVSRVFAHFFTDRKEAYVPLNIAAVQKGFEFAESFMAVPLTQIS
jgi:2-oxoglutarate ferredoxin oxidoreductase subunit gamma